MAMNVSMSVRQMIDAANAVVPRITPRQAQDMMAAGGTFVVDLRDEPEVEMQGMISGAANVSRGMLEFCADPQSPFHDVRFATSEALIVYCASGGRAALGGRVLMEMGYRRVFNLGAFKVWVESGGPVDPPAALVRLMRRMVA